MELDEPRQDWQDPDEIPFVDYPPTTPDNIVMNDNSDEAESDLIDEMSGVPVGQLWMDS
ncbi:hypothetical protein FRB93_011351 [Tulasnella sp. JGI-2019a]|nr:hypothetical protein FRB93_011351 [Tulasnella sp. JGI-2019a]